MLLFYHEDDGEREGCRCAADDERFQGLRIGGRMFGHWWPDRYEPVVYCWRRGYHRVSAQRVHHVSH